MSVFRLYMNVKMPEQSERPARAYVLFLDIYGCK